MRVRSKINWNKVLANELPTCVQTIRKVTLDFVPTLCAILCTTGIEKKPKLQILNIQLVHVYTFCFCFDF